MSLCDFCNNEAKFYFICPKCGDHFCTEHRKPEDHHCMNIQTPIEHSAEKKRVPSQVLDTNNSDHRPETVIDEYINLDEILFTEKNIPAPRTLNTIKISLTVLIIGSLLSVAFMGTLIGPGEAPGKLDQIIDVLFEYFTELQADNIDQNLMDENTTLDFNSLQTEPARYVSKVILQNPAK